jgi:hypothetical protein
MATSFSNEECFITAGLLLPDPYKTWVTATNLQDINRLRSSMMELGLTHRILATQDDEVDRDCLMSQLTEHANLGQEPFFRPLLDFWIDRAVASQPIKRRVDGSLLSWSMQNIKDAGINNRPSSTSSSLCIVRQLIPPPSLRKRSVLSLTEDELQHQRERREAVELYKWSKRLFELYEDRNAPVAVQVAGCMNKKEVNKVKSFRLN